MIWNPAVATRPDFLHHHISRLASIQKTSDGTIGSACQIEATGKRLSSAERDVLAGLFFGPLDYHETSRCVELREIRQHRRNVATYLNSK
jgi:hypothetical protein